MAFNEPRIVAFEKKKAQTDRDRFIDSMIKQVAEGIDYFKDQQLAVRLFTLWLELFKKLKGATDDRLEMTEVVYKHEEWLGLLMTKLRQQEAKLKSQEGLVDRAFGAETALAQRTEENKRQRITLEQMEVKLRSLSADKVSLDEIKAQLFAVETALEQRTLELARAREAQVRAEDTQTLDLEKFASQVRPVLHVAENELALVERIQKTLSGMHSQLAIPAKQLAEAVENLGTKVRPASAHAVMDVAPEIQRRQEFLNQLDFDQSQIEEDRGSLEAELESNLFGQTQSLRGKEVAEQISTLSSRIQEFISLRREVQAELDRLIKYQKAVDSLKAGAPKDLFQKELPQLPENTPLEPVSALPPVEVDPKRHEQLVGLAGRFGITAAGVFIISLYECLPSELQKRSRAVAGILKTADEAGLVERFGLQRGIEIIENWRTPNRSEDKYMQYHGSFGGGMYMRTSTSLDWNIHQLFQPEEIQAFADTAKHNSETAVKKPRRKKGK